MAAMESILLITPKSMRLICLFFLLLSIHYTFSFLGRALLNDNTVIVLRKFTRADYKIYYSGNAVIPVLLNCAAQLFPNIFL